MSVAMQAAARLTNSGGSTEGSGVYLRCGKRTLLVTCAHVAWNEAKVRLLTKLHVKPSGAEEMFDLAIYECAEPRDLSAKVTWEGLLFPWTEGSDGLVSVCGFGLGLGKFMYHKGLSLRRAFDGDGLLQFSSDHTFDPSKKDSGAGVWHGDHLIGIFRQRVADEEGQKAYGVIPLCHVMAAYPELWRSPSLRPEKPHDFFFSLRLGQERQALRDKEAAELYEFPRSVEDPQRLARAMEVHPWDRVLTQKAALSHGAFLLAGEPGGGKTTLSHEAAACFQSPLMLLRDRPLSAALLKWHTDFPALAARCVAGVKLWLDGLDELPDSVQTQWLHVASRYKAGEFKGTCFITCRTAFATPEMNEHITENKPWFLLGLAPQERPKFLRQYAAERLKGFSKEEIEPWVETWQATLGRSPVLARLSGSPLLLRLLAELYDPSCVQDLRNIEGATLDAIYFEMAEGLLKQRKPDVHVQETDTLLECLYHLAGHEQPTFKEWHVQISKPVYAKACKTCKVEPALSDVLERSELIRLSGSRYEWLHLTFLEWAWAAFISRTCDEEAIVALYQTSWHVPRMENTLTLLWGMLETNVRCRLATWLWQHANIVEGERRISCPLRACLHLYGKSGADIEELPELVAFVTGGGEKREHFRRVIAQDKFISSLVFVELSKDESEDVRTDVARNPLAPQQALRCLANDPSEEVRRVVANNSSTTQDLLTELANDPSEEVRSLVAHNSSTTQDLLTELANDPSEEVRRVVAHNSSTLQEMLNKLGGDPSENVRKGVASNASTSQKLLVKLADDPSEDVRGDVASNASTSQKLLIKLADDPSEDVRKGVVRNSSITQELLTQLAHDSSEGVRSSVAQNESAPQELLIKLANDLSEKVRVSVARNKSASQDLLIQLANDPSRNIQVAVARNSSAPQNLLAKLANDPSEEVRCGVVWNSSAPQELMIQLANDPSEEVRWQFAQNSSSQEKVEKVFTRLANDPLDFVRVYVAFYESAPQDLLAQLAGDPSAEVRDNVAANPSAPLSALKILSQDENMLSSLAENPSCPLILLLPEGKRT